MLPHWETYSQHHDLITSFSHIILKLSQPFLIMPSTWISSDKYQFVIHWLDLSMVRSHMFESQDLPKWQMEARLIWPSRMLPSD